ncbi:ferrous iron transport protein B [Lentisalinibacter sediminis]|uniref:ferrous iron transport protein B n=1 Tax=Lentisalinibacter sediminis TaxID=2992237 RepID=UPI00386BC86E
MSDNREIAVPLSAVAMTRRAAGTIALVGNPNAGKSTVFNRLTGMRQHTGNYPGVTVEKKSGRASLPEGEFDLIDLPGTYGMSPYSADERIAVDVLLGRMPGTPPPDAILAVVDATQLYQSLYFLQQLVELERPLLVALTMTDIARRNGTHIDVEALSAKLGGIPIVPVVATTGRGFGELKSRLAQLPETAPPRRIGFWPALRETAERLREELADLPPHVGIIDIERALVDDDPATVAWRQQNLDERGRQALAGARRELFGEEPPRAVEARERYRWIREALADVQQQGSAIERQGARVTAWFSRPWPATGLFILSMAVVFQAVFAWATPMMDLIDAAVSGAGRFLQVRLPDGFLASFLVDGVIAGVGSVVIFLPQIMILFLFLILMEDTGYLARAAFLVDRAMRSVGLSGHSVIPLLSGFACAVPAIMATRVIPNRRDRIATILAAPFMTCSARLPVYALLIAAFVPDRGVGPLNLQGLVLFGLYLLSIFGGVGTALLLKRSALRGERPTFMLTLPEFRYPNLRTVAIKLLDRARIFLRRAGTVIFSVAVIIWALAYFPRSETVEQAAGEAAARAVAAYEGEALEERLSQIENEAAAAQLAQSWLGRAGETIAPVFHPLGWDWRVSAAVLAGFPAREVVVAVLGTIYAVGAEADDERLSERLSAATWPDGTPVFTLPMVLGLLVFYAWCLQCAATLAVIRRETNTWRWPIFAWSYMTALGYLGAFTVYRVFS